MKALICDEFREKCLAHLTLSLSLYGSDRTSGRFACKTTELEGNVVNDRGLISNTFCSCTGHEIV